MLSRNYSKSFTNESMKNISIFCQIIMNIFFVESFERYKINFYWKLVEAIIKIAEYTYTRHTCIYKYEILNHL